MGVLILLVCFGAFEFGDITGKFISLPQGLVIKDITYSPTAYSYGRYPGFIVEFCNNGTQDIDPLFSYGITKLKIKVNNSKTTTITEIEFPNPTIYPFSNFLGPKKCHTLGIRDIGFKSPEYITATLLEYKESGTPQRIEELDTLTKKIYARTTCTDTDEGRDYFVKGRVVADDPDWEYGDNDNCAEQKVITIMGSSTTIPIHVDSCSADDDCYVLENYCDGSIAKNDLHRCLGGCDDGACLEREITCYDSDGGVDNSIKGYVEGYENADDYTLGRYYDTCLSDPVFPEFNIIDFVCNEDDFVAREGYMCEFGCLDGVCVEEGFVPSGDCTLINAYWDYEDAEEGDYVNLIVRGNQACDRESASFKIYEYKDNQETDYSVSGCVFGDVNCITDWRAHYDPEDFDEDYGNELIFYFIATVDGLTITSSNELTVIEGVTYDGDGEVFDNGFGCYENWDCSEWTICSGGRKTRTCVERNDCGTEKYKPSESMSCFADVTATCSDGFKNQGETKVDCGGPCEPCGTCFDGIQNCHDGSCEEKEDCGGPCAPCGNLGWLILKTILILLAIGGVIFGIWYWKFRKSGGEAGKAVGKIIKKPPVFGPPPTRLKIS